VKTASARQRRRRTLFNAWLTLNNPFLIELIGEAGWDCITIDQQHGLGGNEALLGCSPRHAPAASRRSSASRKTIQG
jgi:2-keto-3-deoxy-L-rhamnonate aldolase RhmA